MVQSILSEKNEKKQKNMFEDSGSENIVKSFMRDNHIELVFGNNSNSQRATFEKTDNKVNCFNIKES